ncbi:MAG TPA: hypothetical protein VF743_12965 [Acidimicrobiales bacterium]
MGKASSAKKVARAARAGGRRSAGPRQRNLLFPGAIFAIVVLGIGLVAYAAHDRKTDTSVAPVARQDHWHAAYGIYVCDEFRDPIPTFESPDGIHTHGDGVIHIHPFSDSAAGANATLGKFLEGTDVEISDDELKIGDETFTEGEQKCGDEDGRVVVAQWSDVQNDDGNPALIDEDMNDIRFREDGEGYVIAFVPEDTDIPKPDTAAQLAELGAVDSGAESGTSTTGGEGGASTTGTTAPGGTATTAAGDASTTTTGG